MPRPVTHGTPSVSPRYLRPRRSRVVRWSVVAAAALLTILVVVWGIGQWFGGAVTAVGSPGTVAAGHAAIDARCAQCHQPAKAASDLRCERCHDPIDTRRFENPAHALVAGHDTWHAMKATPVPCATCHDEHRGHAKPLADVDDRRCATCHDFASFGRHPEFAVVRARRGPDEGMEFSHFIHLREVTKLGGERCTPCHVATDDQVRFEPINFDAHCARCHIKDGALTLNGTDLLVSGFTPADLLLKSRPQAPAPQLSAPDGRGRVTFQGVGHRDAWVIANADRLSRALAAESLAAERALLATQQARLRAIVDAAPLPLQADRDLDAWHKDLRGDVASAKRTPPVSSVSNDANGDPLPAGAIDPALAALAAQIAAVPSRLTGAAAAPADAKSVEERRQELQGLLDAVSARAKGPLADRAAALKKRLAAIAPERAAGRSVDSPALAELLNDVDSALAALTPSLRSDAAADLAATRDAVRRQLTGGPDQTTYDARRKQLAASLEAFASRSDADQHARIAELRAAIAALPDHVFGPATIDRQRDRVRLLDRVETETELRKDGNQATPMVKANIEREAARRELRDMANRLTVMGPAGRAPRIEQDAPALAASELGRAKPALRGLLGICLACHRLNEDETSLRLTALNGPVMPDANYSHKPHLGQQICETCHNTIQASKSAVDTNVPGVAACQSCHKAGQAKSGCHECHSYHPRSSAALIMAASR